MASQPTASYRQWINRAALLAVGGALGLASYTVAGWLVGLFAGALPLPAGLRTGVTIVLFALAIYYVAVEPDDEGATLLDEAREVLSR